MTSTARTSSAMTSLQFARRRGRRAAALAFAGAIAAWAAPVGAQPEEAPVVKLDRVEVTGSNIARIEGESGLPVQVITREEMLQGGVQTMQELLDRVSANQSFGGSNPALGVGGMLTGFSAASLRGLGSKRTLVLLNGRRLAPYALSGGQSVDLSGIPASAIERVEILKDGASAVYGTDAIGGVINFILRKDFRGVEFNANYFATEQGGGNNGRISLTAGTGDLARDKYNVFVTADYYRQDALHASQRESTKTSYLPQIGTDFTSYATYPANISQTDPGTGKRYGFEGWRNPTIPYPGGATPESCAPPHSFSTSRSPTRCAFDYASVIDTIPGYETANVLGRLTWDIRADTQFFVEGSYYRGKFTQLISPTPVNGADTLTPMTLPASSPYYPTTYVAGQEGGRTDLPLVLQYRTLELGPRVDVTNVDQWNGVVGLQGMLAGWSYQLAANLTTNRQVDSYVSGAVYESKFGPLLRSGVINPFGPNTAAVLDLMRATQVTGEANDSRASDYGLGLTASNDVARLPAGALAVALGVEGRRESLQQSNSDFIISGDVLGGVGAVPSLEPTHRNVFSLFGEVNVPLAANLEANLALRYDHYSDFGGTTNPKLTLRWQPAKTVMLRAAFGTGYRAPTLSDLHQPQSLFPTDFPDPVRCPDMFHPQPGDDCSGVPIKAGGNPALQPETSRQVNAGIVFEPVQGLSASVDYYRVKLSNVIDVVPLDAVLGSGHADWEAGYIVREPPDPQQPDLPGKIVYAVQYPTNLGTITTSGIDLGLQWQGPATSIGRFSLGLNGTYVLEYTQSGFVSDFVPSGVGMRGILGAIARYRQYAHLDWAFGPWGATLANNYQSGYSEPCSPYDPSGCALRGVGSYSVWDVQVRYSAGANTVLSLGIRNMLDTVPPLTAQYGAWQVGIDPSYADPRGRMFYAALSYAFD